MSTFDVEKDPVPVSLIGNQSVTLKNAAGDTLYYADNNQVSPSNSQGSLTAGNSATFTNGVWVVSASRSSVSSTFTGPVFPASELPVSSDGTRTSVLNMPTGVGLRDILSAKDAPWNAHGDGRAFGLNSITGGTAVLTCSANLFSASDVGKSITVQDAGAAGDSFTTAVLSYQSAGQVTLAANVTTTATSVSVWIGTDDTSALQSFINYLISTGERGIIPKGNYVITAALDFSSMAGSYLGAECRGQGAGAFNFNWDSATNIWCAYAGTAVQGFGVGGTATVLTGLKLGGFAIKCLHLLGATGWAMYFDYLRNCAFEDIAAQGYVSHANSFSQAGQGNGVWINNMPQGQVSVKRVHASKFADAAGGSEGIRFGAKTTAHATAANSGNSTMEACMSDSCHHGFHFAADALTNGCTLSGIKATSAAGPQTGTAFWFDALFSFNELTSPHAEGFPIAYDFENCTGNKLSAALASYTAAAGGDGSTAFKFATSAGSNQVHGFIQGFDIGTSFATGTHGNRVSVNIGWSGLAAPLTSEVTGTSTTNYYENSNTLPDVAPDLGLPGALVPQVFLGSVASAPTATRCYLTRFRPTRPMTINHVAFLLKVAASANDNIDLGIYTLQNPALAFDATTNKLVPVWRLGSTAGLVNSGAPGVVTVATGGVALNGRQVYYAAFAYGTVGGTAAQVMASLVNDGNILSLFSTTPTNRLGGVIAGTFPLPATITALVSADPSMVTMGLLET